MSIGKRLKEARIMRKMTQEDLAAAAGVTKGAIGNYETEVSSPKDTILIKLMEILQIDANFLYQDYITKEDEDQQRLEALHQNPKLRMLFDIQMGLQSQSLDAVLAVVKEIAKERDGE